MEDVGKFKNSKILRLSEKPQNLRLAANRLQSN